MLNSFVGEGHVFCPYDTLVEKSVELLGIDRKSCSRRWLSCLKIRES